MSVSLSAFAVKHACCMAPHLKKEIETKPYLTNGTYYLIPVERTFHYDFLTTGSSKYAEFLESVKDTESHSVDRFTNLRDTFDIMKCAPIQANSYGHSLPFWVQDGNHRLALFKYKIFPDGRIPMSLVNVNFYREVQDEFRNALRKTVGYQHCNGWSNRLEFGYHSFDIFNFQVQGQRNPKQRLQKIKPFYDLTNKCVLDLGCNTGGMLFHASEMKRGIGIDFSQACIDACEGFKKRFHLGCQLDFICVDLNKIQLSTICSQYSFKPDIIFLLSIGSWVENWKKLYTDAYVLAETILLETNNDTEGVAQLELFKQLGATVTLVSDCSDDDCTGNHGRKTYCIKKNT